MIHSPRFLNLCEAVMSKVKEITRADLQKKMKSKSKMVLIDVREDSEWDKGHIPNAIHIGKGILERDIEKTVPDTDREIILYCGGGYRSLLAADSLQKMGYTNVFSLAGGIRDWRDNGGEVTEEKSS